MLKKVGNILLDILFLIIVIFAIIMIMLSINSNKHGIASFMGYSPFSIQTKSMEPTIMSGDLIIVRQKTKKDEVKKGDIISYLVYDEDDERMVLTYRVVEVRETENMLSYITQGDNEDKPNENEVAPGDIIGIYTGTKISKLGSTYEFLNSKNGFLVCIIIPLFVFFVFQVRKFIMILKEIKEDERKELGGKK